MKIIYIPIFTAACGICHAQATLFFRYDEAGNQKYRGPDMSIRDGQKIKEQVTEVTRMPEKEDEKFWSGVRVYPVPIKDILTIDWSDENDKLIDNVSLYQHTTLNFVFQKKNLPNINRQVQIDMSHMYMGVYILTFQLKDGSTISRNIIKE